MGDQKYRLLVVTTHVVQYAAPTFQRLAQHPQLELLVAYCSLQGAKPGFDPEFGLEVKWDVPLLEGYPWVWVPPKFVKPRLGSFWGLINPGLWKLVRTGNFDAILVFGHAYLSCWLAMLATKFSRRALIMVNDATTLTPQDGRNWKVPLKRFLLPRILGLAEVIIASSTGTVNLLRSLGVGEQRIVLSPGGIDNDHFKQASESLSREDLRRQWNLPSDAQVVLFCGKLQPWKRPQDLLRAFARAHVPGSYLLFVGDGPLRQDLERETGELGVTDRVRFLGFLNQSKLPGAYVASDVLVLPSQFETFGFVVSEAMVCGLPAIVSNQVGARFDLIEGRGTGEVFPVGEVDALASTLRNLLCDRPRLREMSQAARARMQVWSPKEKIETFFEAVERAVRLRQMQVHS